MPVQKAISTLSTQLKNKDEMGAQSNEMQNTLSSVSQKETADPTDQIKQPKHKPNPKAKNKEPPKQPIPFPTSNQPITSQFIKPFTFSSSPTKTNSKNTKFSPPLSLNQNPSPPPNFLTTLKNNKKPENVERDGLRHVRFRRRFDGGQ